MSAPESDTEEPCINPNKILPKKFRNKNNDNQDSAIFEEDESSHSKIILARSPENPISPHQQSQQEILQKTTNTINKAISLNKSIDNLSQEVNSTSVKTMLPKLEEKITESDSFFHETYNPNAVNENFYVGRVPQLDFKNLDDVTLLTKKLAIKSENETISKSRLKFPWKKVADKLAGADGENTKKNWEDMADRFCIHPGIGPEFCGIADIMSFTNASNFDINDDAEDQQPKEKRAKQRIVHVEESASKHDQYESNLTGENDQISTKILDTMTKIINSEISKNGGNEIDYWRLILDGKSFAHTVENIFHFSFLVRKRVL